MRPSAAESREIRDLPWTSWFWTTSSPLPITVGTSTAKAGRFTCSMSAVKCHKSRR